MPEMGEGKKGVQILSETAAVLRSTSPGFAWVTMKRRISICIGED
jgi:hypothetical protein